MTGSLGILWSGPLYGESGYAEEARAMIRALSDSPVRAGARSIGMEVGRTALDPVSVDAVDRMCRQPLQPPYVEVVHLYRPALPFRNQAALRVWRTMFETDSLPSAWVACANTVDEVWVPSTFNYGTFLAAGVSEDKLRVIPQTVDVNRWTPDGERSYLAPLETFVFLSIFRWQHRKGWDVLIRAFIEEFTGVDDVALLIKTSKFHVSEHGVHMPSPNLHAEFARAVAESGAGVSDPPRIVLHDGWVPGDAFPRLMRSADCFVLPSRGEGWGRPYMEAMASGVPVIGTAWGGSTEFMTDENALRLNYQLTEVATRATHEWPLLAPGMRWAEPDIDHLRVLMRSVYEDRDLAARKGLAGRLAMVRHFASRPVVARLQDALGELEQAAAWREESMM
ncbi:glycosyltransferase [Micromonospora chalcea]